MTVVDWQAIAAQLYQVALISSCRCQYERTKGGVPMWYPDSAGGIGRKMIHRCSRCVAIDAYLAAKTGAVA